MPRKLIFVSCGVHTEQERDFGRKIGVLIEKCEMTGFLAPAVHQPADLNTHVFKALQRCDGFVAVLQQRGEIHYESFPIKQRGSVWIQQEIGILFYRSFLLGRDIPIHIYREKDVLHEGLTTYSIINPIQFEEEATVLTDLEEWLKSPAFEEPPVLARREDLFRRRARAYKEHDWLFLEIVAAHCRNPGEKARYRIVHSDFCEILREQGKTPEESENLFNDALPKLYSDGVVFRIEGPTRDDVMLHIEPQWWDLVLEALRNQARVTPREHSLGANEMKN